MKKVTEDQLEVRGSGGGSSSGSSDTPTEAPNTLRSVVKGKILDLVAYGPIRGLVNGLKSVYLDDTVVQNNDDTFNFDGINMTQRYGTPDQDYVPGFTDIENSIEIGTEVLYANPPVRSVSNNDADAVSITVQLNALVQQDSKGNTNGASVSVYIDVQVNGGAWIPAFGDTISGKTTSPYPRTYRVNLKQYGSGEFNIRVRRGNKESVVSTLQDKLTWTLLTEIIDRRMSYPNMALIGIEVDSQYFGTSMPSRSYDMYLSIISVPSNYDPDTRTYTGLWDGNFKQAWTDNPAWAFYHLATHPIIGAGLADVDKWELYRIAQYCDELVPDGYGGTEPRFTINTIFSSQEDAITALNTLTTIFRGMSYWGTNTVMPVADMPSDPVKVIGPASVVGGDFEYTGTAMSDRHSVAVVMWNDPDDADKATPEIYEDPDSIQLFGWRETRVTAVGCNSRGQARRLAKWILYSERMETQVINFQGTLEIASLRPGDVIEVADPDYQGARMAGRITAATLSVVTLDKTPTETVQGIGGTWYLSVAMPDGTIARAEVSSFQGNVVHLLQSLPSLPEPGFVWALSSAGLSLPQFRVVGVTEDTNTGLYTVSATEYDPNKYAIVEYDLHLPTKPTSTIPTGAIAMPLDMTFVVYKYQAGGSEHQGISIGWTPPKDVRVTNYILDVMPPDEASFHTVYNGPGASYDLKDVVGGTWTLRVRSVASTGVASAWLGKTVQVQNLLLPVPPDSVTVQTGTFDITLTPVSGYPTQLWEFWRSLSPLTTEQIESNANQLATGISLVDTSLKPDTLYYYYVRGVNQYGKSTWFPVQAKTENNFDDIIEAVLEDVKNGQLYQWINGEIVDTSQELIDEAMAPVNANIQQVQEAITSLNQSVAQQVSELNDDIDTVTDQITGIQDQLNNITDALVYNPDQAYAADDVARVGKKLYRANKDVPAAHDGSNAPPNTEYWDDVGQIVSDANGLAARVDTVETNLSSLNDTVTAQASRLDSVQSALDGKASTTALNSLTTRVTTAEGTITSQGQALTTVTNNLATTNTNVGALQTSFTSLSGTVTALGTTVTNQGQAITSINTSLGNIGGNGTNLLPMEYTNFTAVMPALTSDTTVTLSTEARVQTVGGYLLKAVVGTSANGWMRLGSGASDWNMKLKPSKAYIVSLWVQGDVAHSVGIRVRYRTSGGSSEAAMGTVPATTTLTRVSLVITTPSDLIDDAILVIYSQSTAAAGTTWFDGFMLEEKVGNGTLPSSYSAGYAARQTSALASAATDLTARVASTETGLTSASQSITTLNNNLTFVGSQNYLYNPSFDRAGSAGVADGWALQGTGVSSAVASLVASTLAPDGTAQRISSSSISTTLYAEVTPVVAKRPMVAVASTITLSVNLRGTAGARWEIYIFPLNSSSASTGTKGTSGVLTDAWQRVNVTHVVPAGTVAVSVLLRLIGTSTVSSGFVDFDQVQLEMGSLATGWRDNNGVMAADISANASATSTLNTTVTQLGTSVTSQGQSITTLNNSLAQTGSQNLVYNPSFERVGSTANLADGWVYDAAGGTRTLSMPTSPLDTSGVTQRADFTGLSATVWQRLSQPLANACSVRPGETYTASAYFRATAGTQIKIQVNGTTDAAVATGTWQTALVTATGDWQRLVITFTGTATTTKASLAAVIYGTASLSVGFMELEWAQVELGSVATGWRDNAGTVAADLKATATALSSLTSTVTQQGTNLSSVSQNIVSLTNSLGGAGGENLIYNPDFLRVSTTAGIAEGWVIDGTGGSGVGSLVTSWITPAENSQRIDVTGLSTSVFRSVASAVPQRVKVYPGQTVTASAYVRGTAGMAMRVFLQWINSAGAAISAPSSALVTLTGDTQRLSLTGVAPIGTVSVGIYYRLFGTATVTDGYVEVTRAQAELNDVATGWKNNNQALKVDTAANAAATTSLTSTVTSLNGTVTSQGNLLTTLNNSISGVSGGVNLLSSQFTTFGTLPVNTLLVQSPSTTASLEDNSTSLGGSYLKIAISSATTATVGYFYLAYGSLDWSMKLKPSKAYVFSCWVKTDVARNLSVRVKYRTASGSAEVGVGTVAATTTMTRVSCVFTTPADLIDDACMVFYSAFPAVLNGTAWFDGFMLEEQVGSAATPSTFNNGSTYRQQAAASAVVDSLNSAVTQNATDISSVATRITSMENTVNSTVSGLATKASAASVTTLTNRVTATETSISSQASLVTSLRADLNSLQGANLLPDVYSWITGSTPPMTSSNTAVVTWAAVSAASSGYGLRLKAASASAASVAFRSSSTDYNMTLSAGVYLLSVYISTFTGTVSINGGLVNASTTLIGTAVTATTTRTRYTFTITVPSSGVYAASLLWTGTSDMYVDSLMVEKQSGAGGSASAFISGTSSVRVSNVEGTVSSQATSITSLTSRMGTAETTVSTTASTVNGMTGMWGVKVATSSNGKTYIAGMGVNLTTNNGLTQGEILFQAERFTLISVSNGVLTAPFVVDNGAVYINQAVIKSATINNAMIADASITTAKIADANITTAKIGQAQVDTLTIKGNAVIIPTIVSSGGTVAGAGVNNWQTIATVSFTMDQAGFVMAQFSCYQGFGSGIRKYMFQMDINGTVLATGGGDWADGFPILAGSIGVGTGTMTVTVKWWGEDANVNVSSRNLFIMGGKR